MERNISLRKDGRNKLKKHKTLIIIVAVIVVAYLWYSNAKATTATIDPTLRANYKEKNEDGK
jgi:hypothetical protein